MVCLLEFLNINHLFASALTLILTICLLLFSSHHVAIKTLKSTDYLAKAILLVTSNNKQLQAPEPDLLKGSYDFLVKLTDNIYDLASTSSRDDQNAEFRLAFYTTLTNNIALPVIGLDKDRQICFANNAASDYTGKTNDEIIGKAFYDVYNLSFVSEYTLESWLDKYHDKTIIGTEVWNRVRLQLSDDKIKQFDLVANYSNDNSSGLETVLVRIR
ncbi:MAG: PAS domain-containing protein [Candidatus Saccharibacteria bacterium]